MNFKRLLLAGIFATTLAGGGYAFAASANVSSDSVTAGTAVTASCQAGAMTVTYPAASLTYDASIPGYKVSSATLTGVAGCAGKTAKLQFTGAADAALGEATATLASGSTTFTFSTPVAVASIAGVALVAA